MTAKTLELPRALGRIVLDAARRSFPGECCGLIEGVDTGLGWRAVALHETANLAEHPQREFLVDPQKHFEVLRASRGAERRLIGCFHSHPNGRPEPSERDARAAADDAFVWLIASGGPAAFLLNAFVFDATRRVFLPVVLRNR